MLRAGTSRFLPPSIAGLRSLRDLKLKGCNLHEGDIPDDLGSLSSVRVMDLSENKFCSLPSSIKEMWNLYSLRLNGCQNLLSLTQLSPNLGILNLQDNTSLEKLVIEPNSMNFLLYLDLDNCTSLSEIQGLNKIGSFTIIHIESCNNLAGILTDTFFVGQSEYIVSDIYFPRGEIPDWFEYQTTGSSMCFQAPLALAFKFIGMTLWVVYAAKEEYSDIEGGNTRAPTATIRDITNGVEGYLCRLPWTQIAREEHSWVSFVPRSYFRFPLEGGEEIIPNDEYNNNAVLAAGIKDTFHKDPFPWLPGESETSHLVSLSHLISFPLRSISSPSPSPPHLDP